MLNMAGQLRCKCDFYGRVEYTDDWGNTVYKYELVKRVWCKVLPVQGEWTKHTSVDKGKSLKVVAQVKFVTRINAIKVQNDMYIVYKNQRYDVTYTMPYFQDGSYQEIYTSLVTENDDNLPVI